MSLEGIESTKVRRGQDDLHTTRPSSPSAIESAVFPMCHAVVVSTLVTGLVYGCDRRAPTPSYPRHVVADFGGDGRPDVIIKGLDGYLLFLGSPMGLKEPPEVLLEPQNQFREFVVGDVDGDGRADFVTLGEGPRVIFGASERPFEERPFRFAGHCHELVGVADVDGDGHMDLVCAGARDRPTPMRIDVLKGDGSGGFEEPYLGGQHQGCSPVELGARLVEGEGGSAVDVLVACADREVALLRGDGIGGFHQDWVHGDGATRGVAAGDFDGNGHRDVATVQCASGELSCDAGRGTLRVRFGDGTGGLGEPTAHRVGVGSVDLAVADLDGDGRDDIVVANAMTSELSLLLSTTGLVAHPIEHRASAVALADMDGDGDIDVVVKARSPEGGVLGVIENVGAGELGLEVYSLLPGG